MHGNRQLTTTGWVIVRRWPVVLLVLLLMMPVVWTARKTEGVYWTQQNVVFLPPPGAAAGNPLRSDSQDIVQFAAVIQRRAIAKTSDPPLETNGASLFATGIREGYSVYLPNAGTQWQPSYDRAVITIEVVAETPEAVLASVKSLSDRLAAVASEEQQKLGVIQKAHITTELSPSAPSVSYHGTRNNAAAGALILLALGLSVGAATIADKLLLRRKRSPRKPNATRRVKAKKVPVPA